MPDYRPISRSAHCGNDHWRGSVEVVEGDSRTVYDNVEIDLNTTDEGVNPRVQLADGLWVDVNRTFVTAFRNLTAPLENASTAVCSEALPSPRTPIRLTAVADMTMGTNLVRPGLTHPGFASSFYPSDTFFNPNGELILEGRPAPGLTLTLDVGVGQNFAATQSAGINHGYPFDVLQLFAEYCPGGGIFCMGLGRRVERFGMEVIRSDQRTSILASPNFSTAPFTPTVAEVGLVGSTASLRFAVSPGPDRFWNGDNNGYPYFHVNGTLTYPAFSLFANWNGGPNQDNDTARWLNMADLGLSFGASDAPVRGSLYGMFVTEDLPTGREYGGGANGYLTIRPSSSPVSVNLRGGYTHGAPSRTGLEMPVDLLQLTAGLTVHVEDVLQFRLQGDVLGDAAGTRPFNGENLLPRLMFQVVYTGETNFGVGPVAR
jgi:hypothetical protein